MSGERTHRVAVLRADEVEDLNRSARNELFKCCPHLDVFHARQQREDGSSWRACQIWGCGCAEDFQPSHVRQAMNEQDARWEKQEKRDIAFWWCVFGVVIGLLLGAVLL